MFADYLGGLQEVADLTFEDTFVSYSPGPRGVRDETTGKQSILFAEQGQTLGKVSGRSRGGGDTNTRTIDIGGAEVPLIEGGIHLPITAPLPRIGWEYVCTKAGPRSDPAIEGRRWRVVDVPAKSYATARRLDVVEV